MTDLKRSDHVNNLKETHDIKMQRMVEDGILHSAKIANEITESLIHNVQIHRENKFVKRFGKPFAIASTLTLCERGLDVLFMNRDDCPEPPGINYLRLDDEPPRV